MLSGQLSPRTPSDAARDPTSFRLAGPQVPGGSAPALLLGWAIFFIPHFLSTYAMPA